MARLDHEDFCARAFANALACGNRMAARSNTGDRGDSREADRCFRRPNGRTLLPPKTECFDRKAPLTVARCRGSPSASFFPVRRSARSRARQAWRPRFSALDGLPQRKELECPGVGAYGSRRVATLGGPRLGPGGSPFPRGWRVLCSQQLPSRCCHCLLRAGRPNVSYRSTPSLTLRSREDRYTGCGARGRDGGWLPLVRHDFRSSDCCRNDREFGNHARHRFQSASSPWGQASL